MGKGCRRPASRACRRRSASRPRASAAKAARRQSLLHGSRLRPRLTAQDWRLIPIAPRLTKLKSPVPASSISTEASRLENRARRGAAATPPQIAADRTPSAPSTSATRAADPSQCPIRVTYPSPLSESPIRNSVGPGPAARARLPSPPTRRPHPPFPVPFRRARAPSNPLPSASTRSSDTSAAQSRGRREGRVRDR